MDTFVGGGASGFFLSALVQLSIKLSNHGIGFFHTKVKQGSTDGIKSSFLHNNNSFPVFKSFPSLYLS
jgi:hypothetical protein